MNANEKTDVLTVPEKLKDYFLTLGYYGGEPLGGLGGNNVITLGIYVLASLGIFGRQITQFPKVRLNIANIQWDVLVASFIFGLAILPFFIKRVNAVVKRAGFEQVFTAFGIGFFVDFTSNAIINFYFK